MKFITLFILGFLPTTLLFSCKEKNHEKLVRNFLIFFLLSAMISLLLTPVLRALRLLPRLHLTGLHVKEFTLPIALPVRRAVPHRAAAL